MIIFLVLVLLALQMLAAPIPAPCLAPNEMCEVSAVPITRAAFVLPHGKAPAAVFADGRTLKPGRDYQVLPNQGRIVVFVKSKKPAKLIKLTLRNEPDLSKFGVRLEPPLPPSAQVHRPLPKGRPDNR